MDEESIKNEIRTLEECLRHLKNARTELLKAGQLIQSVWGIDVSKAIEVIDEAINKCNFRLTLNKNLGG